MLYWMCKNSGRRPLTGPQLEHAIQRNFGGLESEKLKPLEVFQKWIGPMGNTEDVPEEVCLLTSRVCEVHSPPIAAAHSNEP